VSNDSFFFVLQVSAAVVKGLFWVMTAQGDVHTKSRHSESLQALVTLTPPIYNSSTNHKLGHIPSFLKANNQYTKRKQSEFDTIEALFK
jgi:hypothetical protein